MGSCTVNIRGVGGIIDPYIWASIGDNMACSICLGDVDSLIPLCDFSTL